MSILLAELSLGKSFGLKGAFVTLLGLSIDVDSIGVFETFRVKFSAFLIRLTLWFLYYEMTLTYCLGRAGLSFSILGFCLGSSLSLFVLSGGANLSTLFVVVIAFYAFGKRISELRPLLS